MDQRVEQPIEWDRVREVQIKGSPSFDPGILILPAIVLMVYWSQKAMSESWDWNDD